MDLRRGKNEERHLTCLTSFRPFRHLVIETKEREDENALRMRDEWSARKTKQNLEDNVLSQLTVETQLFIKDRFRGDAKGKMTNFADARFKEDKYNFAGERRRLFYLYYVDSCDPTRVVHL